MSHKIELEPNPSILRLPSCTQATTPGRVHGIIAYYVGEKFLARLLDDAKLINLKIDALDVLGVTCALDEAFLIDIPDAAAEGWLTVGDVVKTVQWLARDPSTTGRL